MIGKIKKGKGFAGLTRYILEKESAQLICTNLAGDTPQHFYKQLAATRQLNPRVISPVSHISISFALGERPDKQQLQEIVDGTLLGMGFEKCLYFAATHDDRDHFHLHIAATRVNFDGECVPDRWDKRRLEKVLRNLESQFGLTPIPCSWEIDRTATNTGQKRRFFRENQEFEKGLRNKPASKSAVEKIQSAIEAVIQPSVTMTEFLNNLQTLGVETKIKVTNSGEIQGISYAMDGVAFKGAKLGRNNKACTIKGLLTRGVELDLKRDALAFSERATSDSQDDRQTSLNTLIEKIQNHPKNLSLYIVGSHDNNLKAKNKSVIFDKSQGFQI